MDAPIDTGNVTTDPSQWQSVQESPAGPVAGANPGLGTQVEPQQSVGTPQPPQTIPNPWSAPPESQDFSSPGQLESPFQMIGDVVHGLVNRQDLRANPYSPDRPVGGPTEGPQNQIESEQSRLSRGLGNQLTNIFSVGMFGTPNLSKWFNRGDEAFSEALHNEAWNAMKGNGFKSPQEAANAMYRQMKGRANPVEEAMLEGLHSDAPHIYNGLLEDVRLQHPGGYPGTRDLKDFLLEGHADEEGATSVNAATGGLLNRFAKEPHPTNLGVLEGTEHAPTRTDVFPDQGAPELTNPAAARQIQDARANNMGRLAGEPTPSPDAFAADNEAILRARGTPFEPGTGGALRPSETPGGVQNFLRNEEGTQDVNKALLGIPEAAREAVSAIFQAKQSKLIPAAGEFKSNALIKQEASTNPAMGLMQERGMPALGVPNAERGTRPLDIRGGEAVQNPMISSPDMSGRTPPPAKNILGEGPKPPSEGNRASKDLENLATLPKTAATAVAPWHAQFRHLLPFLAHPVNWARGFKGTTVAMTKSPQEFQDTLNALKTDLGSPHYGGMDQGHELYLRDATKGSVGGEAETGSHLLDKFPAVGGLVTRTKQGFAAGLNTVISSTYKAFIDSHPNLTQEQRYRLIDIYNHAGGRAFNVDTEGKAILSEAMSVGLFAGQLQLSRGRMLADFQHSVGVLTDNLANKEALDPVALEQIRLMGGLVAGTTGMAGVVGSFLPVDWRPMSAHFMQVDMGKSDELPSVIRSVGSQVGLTSIDSSNGHSYMDLTGGWGSYIRATSRFFSGVEYDSSGKLAKIGTRGTSYWDIIENLVSSHLNTPFADLVSLLKGHPVDLSQLFLPIMIHDGIQNMAKGHLPIVQLGKKPQGLFKDIANIGKQE